MKSTCCLLVLLCALCWPAMGQVSGYLGKKTVVGVEAGFFPNAWQMIQQEDPLAINLRLGFQAERIVSRQLSVGGHVAAFSTSAAYRVDSAAGRMRLLGQQIGVDFRAYSPVRRGNLPPLGPVHRFGIAYVFYQARDLNRRYFPDGRPDLGRYQAALIQYTLGTQRVWNDRYTTFAGLSFSWTIALSPGTFPDQDLYLWEKSVGRLRGFFGGQLVLGAGILLGDD